MSSISTLSLLQERFPKHLLVKPIEAGAVLSIGKQTSYNLISKNLFPIPLVSDCLGRKMVKLVDVANYIDTLTDNGFRVTKRSQNPGRPTKREQVEAAERGLTIGQFRDLKAGV